MDMIYEIRRRHLVQKQTINKWGQTRLKLIGWGECFYETQHPLLFITASFWRRPESRRIET